MKLAFAACLLTSLALQDAAALNLRSPCPGKQISPADLNDKLTIDFYNSLTPAQKMRLDRANDKDAACAHITMGVSCENTAWLRAIDKTAMSATFAARVCH